VSFPALLRRIQRLLVLSLEFNALEPGERLNKLVMYLRERHWYCFWCKCRYETGEMEGCPGTTEEDHD